MTFRRIICWILLVALLAPVAGCSSGTDGVNEGKDKPVKKGK